MEFIKLEYTKEKLKSIDKIKQAMELLLEVEKELNIKYEISHKPSCECKYHNYESSNEKVLVYKCEYCVNNDTKSV